MREPEGIAFAGDWHGNEFWAASMIASTHYNGCDTIIHTGDYGYDYERHFIEAVEETCAFRNVNIYFVDGNHDLHEFLWTLPEDEDGFGILSKHVRYIPRGHRWQMWDKTFMGVGGAVSVDKRWRTEGKSWWRTEEITDSDVRRFSQRSKVDVLIAHDAPTRVPIPGISNDPDEPNEWPREQIVEAIRHRARLEKLVVAVQPKLLVHGHYHKRYTHDGGGMYTIGLDCDATTWKKNIYIMNVPEELALITG